MVENLHSSPPEARASRGFGLVEALVALVLLGVTAAGIVSLGGASRRLAEIGAVRTAQLMATRVALSAWMDGGPGAVPETVRVGSRSLAVEVETTAIAEGLLEVRVSVQESGPAGPHETVTRVAAIPP